jgi:uncharacterized protein (TIGR02646 family)
MIQLRSDLSPLDETLNKLVEYQLEVDKKATFKERSDEAKAAFSRRNVKTNTAFNNIKETLTAMCSGAKRCAYCEDSMADEVEHIAPKNLYPEYCFSWSNYLYACGPCNGPKNSQFAIFRHDNGQFEDVSPKRGEDVVQPPAGDHALINPRLENAMDLCILDLKGSFKFVLLPGLNDKDKKRADYTFNTVLRLNDQRESLRIARKNAFENYKSRLHRYNDRKINMAPIDELERIKNGILTECHPTVWKEIQRYRRKGWLKATDPQLDALFDTSVEALEWI